MDPLMTVAFMNIGIMESAFEGRNAKKHLADLKTQVQGLVGKHSVKILCFVEVGVPTVGLTPASKDKFEAAVTEGAAMHGHIDLTFLCSDLNEAMVVVHTKEVTMTNGALITNLYQHQKWRNSMQLYLQGPTAEDRIKIFVSHQPSSDKHNLSVPCREEVMRHLMTAGNKLHSWPCHTGATEHIAVARYLIGGDLNTSLHCMELVAAHFKAPGTTTTMVGETMTLGVSGELGSLAVCAREASLGLHRGKHSA